MNVNLFGFSISLNVIILIALLYLIMTVNAITCACNEGFKFKRKRSYKGFGGSKVMNKSPSSNRRKMFGRYKPNKFVINRPF